MKLTIEVRDSVSPRLRDAQGRFQNVRGPLLKGARKVFDIFGRIFSTEGGAGATGRWSRLKPSSVRSKAQAGYGGRPILQRTGAYARALTREGAAGQILRVTANSVEIGTTLPYGPYHQKGTRNMEARPVELTAGQGRQVFTVITRDLADSLQRLGFSVTES